AVVSIDSFLLLSFHCVRVLPRSLHSFPTRRSSDLLRTGINAVRSWKINHFNLFLFINIVSGMAGYGYTRVITCFLLAVTKSVKRSEEHTSELQSREKLVCRLLLEKKKYIPMSVFIS